ncbi:MAG TPA: hypothetical protein VFS39_17410 [Nitrospira sp.]|nr:hypothetical protein [Nitrospira sp.]
MDVITDRVPTIRGSIIGVLLTIMLIGTVLFAPEATQAEDQSLGSSSSDGRGIEVASWALAVPYCLAKSVFAIGGGIVGGLGYVFSGFNAETAKTIWTKSIYGTYIIRPSHLRGEEPVRFLGQADEDEGDIVPHRIEPPPPPSEPAK